MMPMHPGFGPPPGMLNGPPFGPMRGGHPMLTPMMQPQWSTPYGTLGPGGMLHSHSTIHPMGANAPPIHPCKSCKREIKEDELAVQCALSQHGCSYFFHISCAGLTPGAYHALMNEVYAEWICHSCYDEKKVPWIISGN